jgi:L-histidine N-alpha-methyltransferase
VRTPDRVRTALERCAIVSTPEDPPGCTSPAPPAARPPPADDLRRGLLSQPPSVPVRFLYDAKGSDLYEQITQLEDYYPYREERELLGAHAAAIAAHVPAGAVVVELGCGDGSKTAILLRALAARDGPAGVRFLGIDVSEGALAQARRNLARLCPQLPAANLEFLAAEYLPGLAEARARHPDAMLCMLWLGSSVGNFAPPAAAAVLGQLRRAAGGRAALLLCTDLWKEPEVLRAAYDDPRGVTREFIANGMAHALRSVGHPDAAAGGALWRYECVVNGVDRQVEMWLRPRRHVAGLLPGLDLGPENRVLMEISRKFRAQDVAALAHAGGLCIQASRPLRVALRCDAFRCAALRRAWERAAWPGRPAAGLMLASCAACASHPCAAGHLGVEQLPDGAAAAAGGGAAPLLGRHGRPLCARRRLGRPAHRPAPPLLLLLRPRGRLFAAQDAAGAGGVGV